MNGVLGHVSALVRLYCTTDAPPPNPEKLTSAGYRHDVYEFWMEYCMEGELWAYVYIP